jgi:hypothetical protein
MAHEGKAGESSLKKARVGRINHADIVKVMRWALAMARVQEGKVCDAWQTKDVLRLATIVGCTRNGSRDRSCLAYGLSPGTEPAIMTSREVNAAWTKKKKSGRSSTPNA